MVGLLFRRWCVADAPYDLQKCAEPEGVMEQEDAYFDALRTAEFFRVEGDVLEFFNSSGEKLLAFKKE